MSVNESASSLEQTHLADNMIMIGRRLIDVEPRTVPDGTASECHTLITESTADQLPLSSLPGINITNIGKYRIKSILGQGGMGVVYLAFDPLIEREVALKVLSPEVASSTAALQRFLCEARSIGRLNHPNVVSIFEINEWNGMYYLVMELLTGGSVDDLAERSGPLPWREAARITAQAARGLAAAHLSGMIHRDVKPANLMLTGSGDVKVVDFGLSKLLDSETRATEAVTRAGQLLGTPQYMSPEQFDGVAVDLRTDIYALGATFFRLLTDQFPFHECSTIVQLMKAHVMKPVPQATRVVADLPAECDRIISRAMAKDPGDRYTNCNDMAADLEQLLQVPTIPVPTLDAVPTATVVAAATTVPTTAVAPTTPSAAVAANVASRLVSKPNDSERRLATALVVEPSRLQAAMRQDLLEQAGAQTVSVAASIEQATAQMKQGPPDVIWTAMELPDGRSLDWLKSAGAKGSLRNSAVVLNSSDCTIADLTSIGKTGALILAPRTARLESIFRLIHGAGPARLSGTVMRSQIDPLTTSIRLISDTGRVPNALASLLKAMRLHDLEILSPAKSTTVRTTAPALTMLIRTAEVRPGDEAAYAAMVSVRRTELAAAVQWDSGKLALRSIGHSGVVAIVNCDLNESSITALLQAGHSE